MSTTEDIPPNSSLFFQPFPDAYILLTLCFLSIPLGYPELILYSAWGMDAISEAIEGIPPERSL